jgi:hypothetical protein
LPLLALARHGHLPGLNTKALHAQSYGTIRQSTGSLHANKAASMAFYITTSKGQRRRTGLALPSYYTYPSDTGMVKPSTKALHAKSHGPIRQSAGSLHPPTLSYSLSALNCL